MPLLRHRPVILVAFASAALVACTDVPASDGETGLPVRARTDSVDAVNAELERTLWSARTPDDVAEAVWPVLRVVYERRRYEAMWVGDTAKMAAITGALCSAATLGLDPAPYVPRELAGGGAAETPEARARLDLQLSGALALLGRDLAVGGARPGSLQPPWRGDSVARDTTLSALLTAPDPSAALAGLRPRYPEYSALTEALLRYRAIADSGGWSAVTEGPPLRPGARDPRVPGLRARLAAGGDADTSGSATTFDRTLSVSLARFQRRHGLPASGVLDSATAAALNVPARTRVAQLEANLERLRWLPGPAGESYLLSDLRSGRLRAYVGGLLEVTTTIAAAGGAADSAAPLRERSVSAVALGRGRIALSHGDTARLYYGTADSAARLPASARPAHGVRIANAAAVARILLRGVPGWDAERLRATARADTVTTISLPHAVALYEIAPSAYVLDGVVHFRPDRAGADSTLAASLAASRGSTPSGADVVCERRRAAPAAAR